MNGYHDSPTTRLYDDQPTRIDAAGRPHLAAARLCSAGLATALVAALTGVVGILIVRAPVIWAYAPREFGTSGDSTTTAS